MVKSFIKVLSVGLIATGFIACKEQPVGVDFGNAKKSDTSYMATVETPQVKNFYIEEFSGVRCTNCPQGAAKIDSFINAFPDRIKTVTIHAGALTAPNYSKGSIQDLSSAQGGQLMQLIYGQPNKPAASFDRMALGTGTSKYTGNINNWDAMLASAMSQNGSTPVNLYVTSKFNSIDNAYDINVKIAYTSDVSTPYYLSLILIEDNIIDTQIDPHIENFNFRHVFRQMLTPVNGTIVLDDSAKKAGLVVEMNYQFKVDLNDGNEFRHNKWNLDNVHIVALVHNSTAGENKNVIQSQDAHLK